MKANKEIVDNLTKEVAPIQDLEGKMREHYEDMQELQLNEEKRKIAEEEEEETGRKRRIQRKKMGYGESDTAELI